MNQNDPAAFQAVPPPPGFFPSTGIGIHPLMVSNPKPKLVPVTFLVTEAGIDIVTELNVPIIVGT